MKTARILSLVLAVVLSATVCAVFAGCSNFDMNNTKATAASTAAPTAACETAVKATQAPEETESGQVEEDGYIDKATAVAKVKSLAGSGAQIISAEKGLTPDGTKAWVIVVAPVTDGNGPDTVTYYCGSNFCYPEGTDAAGTDDGVDEDGFISQDVAIANVRQTLAGYNVTVISCTKGYTADDQPCWFVAVTYTDENGEEISDVYLSGYQFCYKSEN